MEKGCNPKEYKFILLGDSSVGKTSIFSRLSGESFSENLLPTIGMKKLILNFGQIKIDKPKKVYKNFQIILFDTAGQERYKAITKSYFRDSQGIVLIYSIIDGQSFEHVQIWLDSIKEALSDWKRAGYIVMLLGNKLDLVEENLQKRAIEIEKAQKICSEQGIYWGGECSAKTFDEKQLKEIFGKLVKQVYFKLGEKDINNNKNKKQITKIIYKKTIKQTCFSVLLRPD